MVKLATNTPLDKLLNGGIETDTITNIYGPAGSGKTNIVLSTVLNCIKEKKVIYIDTEGSFSLERFIQLGGSKEMLKKIIFFEVHDWDEQHKKILSLEKIVSKEIGLIVIDSLVALYRLKLNEKNFQEINRQLATQYSILSKIARTMKIPVLVTNQVYSKGEEIEMTSRNIGRYWSKNIIELKRLGKNNCRIAVIKKHRSMPEGKKIEFEITSDSIKEPGRFKIFVM